MRLRQESAHRCGNNLHLFKGFSGQPHDVRVAGQQARREAEGEVYRNVGRRRMENDTFSEAIIHIVDFRVWQLERHINWIDDLGNAILRGGIDTVEISIYGA